MDFLFHVPVILRVLLSLVVILCVHGLTRSLTLGALVGAVVLSLWLGHPFLVSQQIDTLDIFYARLTSTNMLGLVGSLFLVVFLSHLMRVGGVMQLLVSEARGCVGRRNAMAVLPSLIGWLPMPGGASFSAPLVDQCDDGQIVESLLKVKINYWFRHIWGYWWPLYPGVILALDYTGLRPGTMIVLLLPLSIASAIIGYVFLIRRLPPDPSDAHSLTLTSVLIILNLVSPVIYVVIVYWTLESYYPELNEENHYLPMIIGLALAIVVVQLQHRLRWHHWSLALRAPNLWRLLRIVVAMRLYGAVLEFPLPNGNPLVGYMHAEMEAWGYPLATLFVVLPFVCGLTSGIAVAYVGASFPVLMQLLGAHPPFGDLLAATVLAYGSGYIGMLISPVHVCLIVTNQHFSTRLQHSLQRILPLAASMWIVIFVYAALIYLLWPFIR